MARKNKLLLIALLWCSVQMAQGQSIFGKWMTIDDRTDKPKAIVEVYKKDGDIHGKILKILEEGKENAKCVKCKGTKRNKPIVGMRIIEGLKKYKDGQYKGKTLFDPEQAMTFRCKIWLNPKNSNELKVRGYLAFLYRTQTWIRVED
ncbi:DUF2147 domain-containing protein [Flavobacteriaceae bacterium 3-367]|uniref:DUF2147 domain-containing protein n=1 Tax=Eudoraea algarum TaxID=3417568 RepID=UPI0032774A3D